MVALSKHKRKRRTRKEIKRDLLEYLADQDFGVTTQQTARENRMHINTANRFLKELLDEGLVFLKKVGRQNQWCLMEYYKPWKKKLEKRRGKISSD